MVAHSGTRLTRKRVVSHGLGELLTAAKRESGPAFDSPVRQRLESGLRTDFSHVRVHSGSASARAAETLGARAFTSDTMCTSGMSPIG